MSRSSTPVRTDTTIDLITLEMDSPTKYDPRVCRATADGDSTTPFIASDNDVEGDYAPGQIARSETRSPDQSDRKPLDS